MSRKTMFILSALFMLVLANILMMSYSSPVFGYTAEGFEAQVAEKAEGKEKKMGGVKTDADSFSDYHPAGAKNAYVPIGPFDGVKLQTGNSSSWRYTKPNEPLNGYFPKFQPGQDNLFMFKDNQAKPECCGGTYSTDTGCVCTTPEQRDMINMRGGNRAAGLDPDM